MNIAPSSNTPSTNASSLFQQHWSIRLVVALLIFGLPVSFLAWKAFVSDGVRFLPYSLHADWMFHPDWERYPDDSPGRYPSEVVFSTELNTGDPNIALDDMHITVYGELIRLFVGDEELLTRVQRLSRDPFLDDNIGGSFAGYRVHGNWKSGFSINLTEFTDQEHTRLDIVIYSGLGRPGILVRSPASHRTTGSWTVQASGSEDRLRPAGTHHRVEKEFQLGRLPFWGVIRWLVAGFILAVLIISAYSMRPRESREHSRPATPLTKRSFLPRQFGLYAVVVLFLSLNLWNAYAIPSTVGLDALQH